MSLEDVPRLLVVEHLDALLVRDLRACGCAGQRAFLALDAEADQRAHLAAQLDGLFVGEVAQVRDGDLAVGVLVHGQRVDHPDHVALAQLLELRDDVPVEVRLVESEDDELNRSDCHVSSPSSRCSTEAWPHRARRRHRPFGMSRGYAAGTGLGRGDRLGEQLGR